MLEFTPCLEVHFDRGNYENRTFFVKGLILKSLAKTGNQPNPHTFLLF